MVSVGRDCGSEQCWRGLHVQGWGGSASRISLTTSFWAVSRAWLLALWLKLLCSHVMYICYSQHV